MARLISSQKETEFFKSNYDDLKKIYSIWIRCAELLLESEKKNCNGIEKYVDRDVRGYA